MIAKTSAVESRRERRKRQQEPLDVALTVKFKFGDEPDDSVTVMNERSIPMVNSVFKNRDRIIKSFVRLLVRTGLSQPKVTRELFPALRLLKRNKK
jgi:hypothetical protein